MANTVGVSDDLLVFLKSSSVELSSSGQLVKQGVPFENVLDGYPSVTSCLSIPNAFENVVGQRKTDDSATLLILLDPGRSFWIVISGRLVFDEVPKILEDEKVFDFLLPSVEVRIIKFINFHRRGGVGVHDQQEKVEKMGVFRLEMTLAVVS